MSETTSPASDAAPAAGAPGAPPPQGPPGAASRRRPRWGRRLLYLALLLVAGAAALRLWWTADIADPFPEYTLDLRFAAQPGADESGALRVGVAKVEITPVIVDSWNDADSDGAYDPADGDTYIDRNGNGRFDAVWMAGFGPARPATGVHDPLWARALVVEVGGRRVALVSLDLVGFFHTDVIRIRKELERTGAHGAPVDYLLVAGTHTHEGPDTLGLWGRDLWTSGVDPEYLASVRTRVVEAVRQAVADLAPARLFVGARNYGWKHNEFGPDAVVYDHSRRPFVLDDTLGVMQFVGADGATRATFVSWSSHPETMGDEQTLITSDWPHFLREGVEQGVGRGGAKPVEGLGGTCVFFNGSLGGMVTSMSMPLPDRETGALIHQHQPDGTKFPWSRPQAVGDHVAAAVLEMVHGGVLTEVPRPRLAVRARTFFVEMQNPMFRLGAKLGRLDRGSIDGRMRSEVALIDLGPVRLIAVPGEIYPELVIGGIENPEGADFTVDPHEHPPLKTSLAGAGLDHLWVLGLANDELGYFIPKAEWDATDSFPWDSDGTPPYLYGAKGPPYGEENSCGPDAAEAVRAALVALGETRIE